MQKFGIPTRKSSQLSMTIYRFCPSPEPRWGTAQDPKISGPNTSLFPKPIVWMTMVRRPTNRPRPIW